LELDRTAWEITNSQQSPEASVERPDSLVAHGRESTFDPLYGIEEATNKEAWPLGGFVPNNSPDYREPSVSFDAQVYTDLKREGISIPLSVVRQAHFPDLIDEGREFECPLPLSLQFWHEYREPLWLFRKWTQAFLDMASRVQSRSDLRHLEILVAPAGSSLSFGADDRIQETWVCPSLLSVFGRMFLQDLSAGKRCLRCACCGLPFVSDNYQALYCSQKCGSRLRQRRSRAKTAKAKRMEDQGGQEAR
jgi:hypothetical protein